MVFFLFSILSATTGEWNQLILLEEIQLASQSCKHLTSTGFYMSQLVSPISSRMKPYLKVWKLIVATFLLGFGPFSGANCWFLWLVYLIFFWFNDPTYRGFPLNTQRLPGGRGKVFWTLYGGTERLRKRFCRKTNRILGGRRRWTMLTNRLLNGMILQENKHFLMDGHGDFQPFPIRKGLGHHPTHSQAF